VSRTACSRASRWAAVSQTRTPTWLPVGLSVWQVTFELAFGAFESAEVVWGEATTAGEVAVVEVTAAVVGTCAAVPPAIIAPGAGTATTAGALAVDACSDAQPQRMTLTRTMMTIGCAGRVMRHMFVVFIRRSLGRHSSTAWRGGWGFEPPYVQHSSRQSRRVKTGGLRADRGGSCRAGFRTLAHYERPDLA